jgi:hypothetical protein
VELDDDASGRLHCPPGCLRPEPAGRDFGRRRGGATVQAFRLAAGAQEGVAKRVEPLEAGRRLELPPEGPLAQVVPLGQEPAPVVEARDPLTAKPVHQGLESSVGCQDRQGRVTGILGGPTGHLLGQGQELGRLTHLRSLSSRNPRLHRGRPTGCGRLSGGRSSHERPVLRRVSQEKRFQLEAAQALDPDRHYTLQEIDDLMRRG